MEEICIPERNQARGGKRNRIKDGDPHRNEGLSLTSQKWTVRLKMYNGCVPRHLQQIANELSSIITPMIVSNCACSWFKNDSELAFEWRLQIITSGRTFSVPISLIANNMLGSWRWHPVKARINDADVDWNFCAVKELRLGANQSQRVTIGRVSIGSILIKVRYSFGITSYDFEAEIWWHDSTNPRTLRFYAENTVSL